MDDSKTDSAPIPLLMNDKAGALHTTAGADELTRLAAENGVGVEVIATKSPDDTTQTLRRLVAGGTKRVAVAGGDGTIACAVQVLAGTGVALGIVPQGTANNFANALKLPLDIPSALRVLGEGVVRPIDLGRVGDLYFTESAGVGLFADAMTLQKPTDKNILHAFYTLFRVFLSARARRVNLFIDNELHIERAVMCEVANSFRMGYAIPVAPEAKLTDGFLDVVIVGDLSRGELLPYFNAMRKQLHRSLPKVQQLKAKQVRIESRHKMNVHCDDSVIGIAPVTIDCAPGALCVLMERL
ncbi:MAG: diacylglycerol kinase family lipid kinase [Armatimonadetes bacterium]|nr:diacylglycerol kinase family lipid kinase [Armatimonadota bacterium]